MILVFLYGLIQTMTGAMDGYASGVREVTTFLSLVTFGIMLILSTVLPIGDDIIEIKPAINTKVGNELIIQAEGWPTQVINDIAFIDKEVQVKKLIRQNTWGADMYPIYTVEPLIKTEVE